MLLAAVLVVCVASSADARRRHHHGYYGYGERSPSSFDDWRRARDAQSQGQDRGQGSGQDQAQGQGQDQRQDQNQSQSQDQKQVRVQDRRDYRAQDPGQARGDRRRARSLDEWRRSRESQNQGQDSGQNQGQDSRQDLARDRGQDRSRDYDRRRARYDEWRRSRDERRARYEDWRRGRERADWTRPRDREAERGDAALRRTRSGPFGAVVEKLVRGCGQQGAEFENWPFDAIAQTAGADEGRRNALAALRERAKAAAERLAADCPQDVGAAPAARLEAVEQGIDAALAAFDTVEPALATFYGTLDDEQKARLYRDMAAPAAANARATTPRREAQEERRERRAYSSRRDRWRAYAAAREAAAREPTPSQGRSQAAAPGWSGAMCEELAAVLRGWPVREIERDVRLSSPQRVAFYELVTASLKAADTSPPRSRPPTLSPPPAPPRARSPRSAAWTRCASALPPCAPPPPRSAPRSCISTRRSTRGRRCDSRG